MSSFTSAFAGCPSQRALNVDAMSPFQRARVQRRAAPSSHRVEPSSRRRAEVPLSCLTQKERRGRMESLA